MEVGGGVWDAYLMCKIWGEVMLMGSLSFSSLFESSLLHSVASLGVLFLGHCLVLIFCFLLPERWEGMVFPLPSVDIGWWASFLSVVFCWLLLLLLLLVGREERGEEFVGEHMSCIHSFITLINQHSAFSISSICCCCCCCRLLLPL